MPYIKGVVLNKFIYWIVVEPTKAAQWGPKFNYLGHKKCKPF